MNEELNLVNDYIISKKISEKQSYYDFLVLVDGEYLWDHRIECIPIETERNYTFKVLNIYRINWDIREYQSVPFTDVEVIPDA